MNSCSQEVAELLDQLAEKTTDDFRRRWIDSETERLGGRLERLAADRYCHLKISPAYGRQDCDTMMVLQRFHYELTGSKVLEIGANESHLSNILVDNDCKVLGIDLRSSNKPVRYARMRGDFVELAPYLTPDFDSIISTSALEHFGLQVYGQQERVEDYDAQAMQWAFRLLKPGGTCHVTVPYCGRFREYRDWRVYDAVALQNRIIQGFKVEERLFFLSGECQCPDRDGMVTEEDADNFSGVPPHVTVFLKLRKSNGR